MSVNEKIERVLDTPLIGHPVFKIMWSFTCRLVASEDDAAGVLLKAALVVESAPNWPQLFEPEDLIFLVFAMLGMLFSEETVKPLSSKDNKYRKFFQRMREHVEYIAFPLVLNEAGNGVVTLASNDRMNFMLDFAITFNAQKIDEAMSDKSMAEWVDMTSPDAYARRLYNKDPKDKTRQAGLCEVAIWGPDIGLLSASERKEVMLHFNNVAPHAATTCMALGNKIPQKTGLSRVECRKVIVDLALQRTNPQVRQQFAADQAMQAALIGVYCTATFDPVPSALARACDSVISAIGKFSVVPGLRVLHADIRDGQTVQPSPTHRLNSFLEPVDALTRAETLSVLKAIKPLLQEIDKANSGGVQAVPVPPKPHRVANNLNAERYMMMKLFFSKRCERSADAVNIALRLLGESVDAVVGRGRDITTTLEYDRWVLVAVHAGFSKTGPDEPLRDNEFRLAMQRQIAYLAVIDFIGDEQMAKKNAESEVARRAAFFMSFVKAYNNDDKHRDHTVTWLQLTSAGEYVKFVEKQYGFTAGHSVFDNVVSRGPDVRFVDEGLRSIKANGNCDHAYGTCDAVQRMPSAPADVAACRKWICDLALKEVTFDDQEGLDRNPVAQAALCDMYCVAHLEHQPPISLADAYKAALAALSVPATSPDAFGSLNDLGKPGCILHAARRLNSFLSKDQQRVPLFAHASYTEIASRMKPIATNKKDADGKPSAVVSSPAVGEIDPRILNNDRFKFLRAFVRTRFDDTVTKRLFINATQRAIGVNQVLENFQDLDKLVFTVLDEFFSVHRVPGVSRQDSFFYQEMKRNVDYLAILDTVDSSPPTPIGITTEVTRRAKLLWEFVEHYVHATPIQRQLEEKRNKWIEETSPDALANEVGNANSRTSVFDRASLYGPDIRHVPPGDTPRQFWASPHLAPVFFICNGKPVAGNLDASRMHLASLCWKGLDSSSIDEIKLSWEASPYFQAAAADVYATSVCEEKNAAPLASVCESIITQLEKFEYPRDAYFKPNFIAKPGAVLDPLHRFLSLLPVEYRLTIHDAIDTYKNIMPFLAQLDAMRKEENNKAEQTKQETEAKRQAAEQRKQQAAEQKKKLADEEAKRQADEQTKRRAAEQKKLADEEAKRQAGEEAKRQADEVRRQQAAEQKRLEDEEAKRQTAERKKQADDEAKRQADEASRQQAAEQKKQAEDEAKRQAAERKKQADDEAKRQAAELEKRKQETAEQKRRQEDEEKKREEEAEQKRLEDEARQQPQIPVDTRMREPFWDIAWAMAKTESRPETPVDELVKTFIVDASKMQHDIAKIIRPIIQAAPFERQTPTPRQCAIMLVAFADEAKRTNASSSQPLDRALRVDVVERKNVPIFATARDAACWAMNEIAKIEVDRKDATPGRLSRVLARFIDNSVYHVAKKGRNYQYVVAAREDIERSGDFRLAIGLACATSKLAVATGTGVAAVPIWKKCFGDFTGEGIVARTELDIHLAAHLYAAKGSDKAFVGAWAWNSWRVHGQLRWDDDMDETHAGSTAFNDLNGKNDQAYFRTADDALGPYTGLMCRRLQAAGAVWRFNVPKTYQPDDVFGWLTRQAKNTDLHGVDLGWAALVAFVKDKLNRGGLDSSQLLVGKNIARAIFMSNDIDDAREVIEAICAGVSDHVPSVAYPTDDTNNMPGCWGHPTLSYRMADFDTGESMYTYEEEALLTAEFMREWQWPPRKTEFWKRAWADVNNNPGKTELDKNIEALAKQQPLPFIDIVMGLVHDAPFAHKMPTALQSLNLLVAFATYVAEEKTPFYSRAPPVTEGAKLKTDGISLGPHARAMAAHAVTLIEAAEEKAQLAHSARLSRCLVRFVDNALFCGPDIGPSAVAAVSDFLLTVGLACVVSRLATAKGSHGGNGVLWRDCFGDHIGITANDYAALVKSIAAGQRAHGADLLKCVIDSIFRLGPHRFPHLQEEVSSVDVPHFNEAKCQWLYRGKPQLGPNSGELCRNMHGRLIRMRNGNAPGDDAKGDGLSEATARLVQGDRKGLLLFIAQKLEVKDQSGNIRCVGKNLLRLVGLADDLAAARVEIEVLCDERAAREYALASDHPPHNTPGTPGCPGYAKIAFRASDFDPFASFITYEEEAAFTAKFMEGWNWPEDKNSPWMRYARPQLSDRNSRTMAPVYDRINEIREAKSKDAEARRTRKDVVAKWDTTPDRTCVAYSTHGNPFALLETAATITLSAVRMQSCGMKRTAFVALVNAASVVKAAYPMLYDKSLRESAQKLWALLSQLVPQLANGLGDQATETAAAIAAAQAFVTGNITISGDTQKKTVESVVTSLVTKLLSYAPRGDEDFGSIIGNERVKNAIATGISKTQPARNMYACLLYGPPGTGKTELIKAAAALKGSLVLTVDQSDLAGTGNVGGSEMAIATFFAVIRCVVGVWKKPLLVFVDECELLFPDRTTEGKKAGGAEKVNGFLTNYNAMNDDAVQRNLVSFMMATNIPTKVDSAVRSRMGNVYYVKLPEKDDCEAIFRLFLGKKMPYLDFTQLAVPAKQNRLSGRAIKRACDAIELLPEDEFNSSSMYMPVKCGDIAKPDHPRHKELSNKQIALFVTDAFKEKTAYLAARGDDSFPGGTAVSAEVANVMSRPEVLRVFPQVATGKAITIVKNTAGADESDIKACDAFASGGR